MVHHEDINSVFTRYLVNKPVVTFDEFSYRIIFFLWNHSANLWHCLEDIGFFEELAYQRRSIVFRKPAIVIRNIGQIIYGLLSPYYFSHFSSFLPASSSV